MSRIVEVACSLLAAESREFSGHLLVCEDGNAVPTAELETRSWPLNKEFGALPSTQACLPTHRACHLEKPFAPDLSLGWRAHRIRYWRQLILPEALSIHNLG